MNILLDTNILIPLEDTNRTLDPRLAEMRRGVEELGYHLCIHPLQIEDINRDRDAQRRSIVLSRLGQYSPIPNPPVLTGGELNQYGWTESNDNDRIDNLLLHALCRGAVHILVSNDEMIHRKANRTGIQSQVYRLEQILSFLAGRQAAPFQVPYGIRERYLHEFNVQQPFFDSLRSGYGAARFNQWYRDASTQRRKCWSISPEDASDIQALCIYKCENSPVVTTCGVQLQGTVLKLCTLKVGEPIRGKKVGERLLYTAFKYATENQMDYIYIHAHSAWHEHLISLVEDYGFQRVGQYGEDDVYAKPMKVPNDGPSLTAIDWAIRYYPCFKDDSSINKFIVPIRPQYHEDLFPDISNFSDSLFGGDPTFFSAQSNTIKKAYLCHASTTRIGQGDLLLFYRTQDRRSIQVVGIVEKTIRTQDLNLALSLVSKRTVFNPDTLAQLLSRPTLIILFRLVKYIPAIFHDRFGRVGITGTIQSLRQISHQTYTQLLSDV
jgi:hypothetical protein